MRKLIKAAFDNNIPLIPLAFVGIVSAYREMFPDKAMTAETWLALAVCALIPWFLLWTGKTSSPKYQNEHYDGRSAAMRPNPPPDMLYKQPVGFCFGTFKGQYVCKRVDEPGSILVCGGSGTGKSASIIQSFLLNPENKKNCNTLTLDLKHELADFCVAQDEVYSTKNQAGTTILLDPLDRQNGYGYDPFFQLSEKSTDTEVHEVMEVVASSLIPVPKGDNAIWGQQAQQFLRGAMTFFYQQGHKTLPDIIRAIKAAPIQDITEQILSSAVPGSTAYIDIIGFSGMPEETIMSVSMNLTNAVTRFITSPDLEWCLGTNPRKCNPADMLERSIYLCLPEHMLTEWSPLVFLVFNQFLSWMMGLPEHASDPERKRFALILDETVALLKGVGAPMPLLSQCLRIGARGKGCTMLICAQSLAGLDDIMGHDEVKDMVSNMSYKYILDSSDTGTSDEIIKWGGKFLRRKVSTSGAGMEQKSTVSYEQEDIITHSDLMTLPKSGDIILITNRAGYLRLKKCFVFKDPYFKRLLEQVKQSKQKKEDDKCLEQTENKKSQN
ncbi:MAG: type IV secretory system conjugative DNA transfer family protein [Lachnospiraceae bacterium]|nr:type IV secretory system conjugative DNA transfer family protein [Lachnospiraceae bacterium]MBR1851984.1 type IV secretory system conjugative DNA transfer family protein [Lachnospiraceae bacterium]